MGHGRIEVSLDSIEVSSDSIVEFDLFRFSRENRLHSCAIISGGYEMLGLTLEVALTFFSPPHRPPQLSYKID